MRKIKFYALYNAPKVAILRTFIRLFLYLQPNSLKSCFGTFGSNIPDQLYIYLVLPLLKEQFEGTFARCGDFVTIFELHDSPLTHPFKEVAADLEEFWLRSGKPTGSRRSRYWPQVLVPPTLVGVGDFNDSESPPKPAIVDHQRLKIAVARALSPRRDLKVHSVQGAMKC